MKTAHSYSISNESHLEKQQKGMHNPINQHHPLVKQEIRQPSFEGQLTLDGYKLSQ